MKARNAALGLCWVVSVGCAGEVTTDGLYRDGRGLVIAAHEADLVRGGFYAGDAVVEFEARALDAGFATLEMTINGKYVGYQTEVTEDGGWFEVIGGAQLTPADLAAATAVSASLGAYLAPDGDPDALHETVLLATPSVLATLKPGDAIPSFHRKLIMVDGPVSQANGDEGSKCIKRGSTYSAFYDNSNGAGTTKNVTCNSNLGSSACGGGDYSCMGKCAAGCGFGWAWTLDCLEHDICSHDLCASGGSSDPNCGDEYNDASGDFWAFGCGG